MPKNRVAEAERVLETIHRKRKAQGSSPHSSGTAVVSWDSWLDLWDAALADQPAPARSIAADLVQLRELCATLGGLVVEPFADASFGAEWREREKNFHILVDQVLIRSKDYAVNVARRRSVLARSASRSNSTGLVIPNR